MSYIMSFEEDIKNTVTALEERGLILYPTDTIWGIGCNALDEEAIDRVFVLKQRPREKSLIVLLAEARDILQYVAAPHPDIIGIVENFERPTTVVFEGALHFPSNAVHEDGSIAIRVTRDPFCKALIKRFRKPIISTSANTSGNPFPKHYKDIEEQVKNGVDYIVKYRQDDTEEHQPSRLVRINDDGSLQILRP